MNQNNDKCQIQQYQNSEIVKAKLKQIRNRVFGDEKYTTYLTSLKKTPLQSIKTFDQNKNEGIFKQISTPKISDESSTKKHQRSESLGTTSSYLKKIEQNDKENSYHSRIKNIDTLGEKIKSILQGGHQIQKPHSNMNKNSNYQKTPSENLKAKRQSKNYRLSIDEITEKKPSSREQSKELKNIEQNLEVPKFQEKIKIKSKCQLQNEKAKENNANYSSYNQIEQKLIQLRFNRAKIKKQLGIKQKQVKQVKTKQKITKNDQINSNKFKRQSNIFQEINQNNNHRKQIVGNKLQNFDSIKQVESVQIKNDMMVSNEKVEIVKLAQKLGEQITNDQKMRVFRTSFCMVQKPNKWVLLKQQLQTYQIYKQADNLEQQLTMWSEEHNPFDQIQHILGQMDCIKSLAKSYEHSLRFWSQKLKGCVSIQKLESESFTIKDIDLNKKGYLSIEDLVCFINLYSGNFFRNRDVILTYRRFLKHKKSNNLSYEDFLSVVMSS